ncbi:MAG: alpha/beta hydrolase, partial [Candidatus Promineifilaceae bacterium]
MKLARLIIILFASFTLLVACSDDPQNAVEVPPLPLITTSATVATEAVDTESEAETIADDSAEIESTDPLIVTEVENEHSAELTPGDCPFEEGERNFECGTIRVTETRDPAFADEDNSITLAYAVMKSSSATPAADPLVYLEGGPGGDTMTTVDWFLADYMSVFLAERDVIFFSHRGSAGATPHLDCAPLTDIDYQYLDQPAEANDAYDAAFREAIFGCRDELIAEGANLASYNSAESAADVKDLLTALGYEQASFYGASYGTRLAQTIMRDHPQIVRSAIIDAVVPLDKTFEPSVITSMDRAFEHLFAACTQDSACNAIYPDLRGVFYSTVDLLNETPVLVEGASDRYTGVSRDVMVNGDMLMNGLFGALYADFQLPELPKAIYDAQAGDYELFIDEAFYNIFSGELLFSEIQHLTTVCYEDVAFDTQADFDAAAATVEPRIASFNLDSDSYYSVCADVIDRTAAPLENEAVLSDIPTLILSGAFDPITPPAYGAAVAANLSNSTHLTFSMLSHG